MTGNSNAAAQGTALNLLVVEDVEDDALLTALELKRGGYEVNYRRVETAEDMLDALNEGIWDIIISDYSMPYFSGIEALELYKEYKKTGRDIPFILISGNIVDQVAVDAMIKGANDYITKDNLSRLIPAVGRELEDARVRRKQAAAEEEIRRLNEELEQRVKNRTLELQIANESLNESLVKLKRTKDQLVQSEKMAALGSLVASVAHEIKTPIGVGVTAASLLNDKTKGVDGLYHAGELKRSELDTYTVTVADATKAILINLKRAAELIMSFKQVAVDQSTEKERAFNIKDYLDEVLYSLSYKYTKQGHRVVLNCPDDIIIESYPGVFFQIITNLVMNSLIHGFEEREGGEMHIDISIEESELLFIYRDNGKGMDEDSLQKIFEPFYTTKRSSGGTGLGMHIVYNQVTQTLQGQIECKSDPGEGGVFTIRIPAKRVYGENS
ncbi:MAG: hybrid sensor histidine kinase/response regulator [bacterium]|nr:hybrid sensor histidine kinase/response regulator [bacterium]